MSQSSPRRGRLPKPRRPWACKFGTSSGATTTGLTRSTSPEAPGISTVSIYCLAESVCRAG
jgi:hypothetical protein